MELFKSWVYVFSGGCLGENPGFSSKRVAALYDLGLLMTKRLSKKEKEAIKDDMKRFRLQAGVPIH